MAPTANGASRRKRISETTIAAVRDRADLLSIVEEHVAMKRAGSGHKGLCPFHDEKTPSFTVNTTTGTWKCFGCGAGGDAIAFIQEIEGENFPWAVEYLADRLGMPLDHDHASEPEDAERQQRERLRKVLAAAAAWFTEQLLHDDDAQLARDELERRHFTLADAAERFGCGYAPRSSTLMLNELRRQGFTDHEMETAGLTATSNRGTPRPRFRGRLIWTIRDTFGHPVGFGARRLYDDDPLSAKFINTAETPLYKKSDVLYGFDVARKDIAKSRHAVIVEGYTDVMAAHLAGITNTVATCGTAFTAQHLATLRRIVGDTGEITFALDDDQAGRAASTSIYDTAKGSVKRLTALPPTDGLDPDDYRREHGDNALAQVLEHRQPLLQSVISSTLMSLPTDTVEDRIVALDAALPLIQHATDPIARREYAGMVAGQLHLTTSDVLDRLPSTNNDSDPATPATTAVASSRPTGLDLEQEVVTALVQSEAAAQAALERVRPHLTYPVSTQIAAAIEGAFSDPSSTRWALKVRDRCDEQARAIVDQILATPLPVAPERAADYGTEMADRLIERSRGQHRKNLIKALAQTTDTAERDQIFQQLTEADGA